MVATPNRIAVAGEEFPVRLPNQLVQDFHAAFGDHHARAVHTKGLILQGTYTPSPEARGLCRAQLFLESSVPVVVRFSDFTGLPNIPDTEVGANPAGFAMRSLMSDGSNTDIVNDSFNGFPVSTSSEFERAVAGDRPQRRSRPRFRTGESSKPSLAKTFLTTETQLPKLGHHRLLFRQRGAVHRRPGGPFCPLSVQARGRRAQPQRGRGSDEAGRLPLGGTRGANRRQPGRFSCNARSPSTPTSSTIPPRLGRTTGNVSRSVIS